MPEYLRLAMKEAIQTKDVEAGTVTQLCEKAHARLIFQSRRWLFLLTPRAVGVMGLNSRPNFRNSWPKNRSLHTHTYMNERVFLVHTKCVYIMYTLCGLKYNCISNCNVYYAFFASSYYVCAVRACTCMQKLLRTFLHFQRRHDDKWLKIVCKIFFSSGWWIFSGGWLMKSNPFFSRGVGGGEDCDLFLYFIFLNIQPGILIVKITWSV